MHPNGISKRELRKCQYEGCNYQHRWMAYIIKHQKLCHEEAICSYCGETIKQGKLDKHVAEKHTLDLKHACHICPEKFYRAAKLKDHIDKVHIRDPKYICVICNKGYMSKRLLAKHRYNIHVKKKKRLDSVKSEEVAQYMNN